MSHRALSQQFAALGIQSGEFKPHVSEGGAHKEFTPSTGNEVWDSGSYFAGKKKEGGVWPFLDDAVRHEYGHRRNPFSPEN